MASSTAFNSRRSSSILEEVLFGFPDVTGSACESADRLSGLFADCGVTYCWLLSFPAVNDGKVAWRAPLCLFLLRTAMVRYNTTITLHLIQYHIFTGYIVSGLDRNTRSERYSALIYFTVEFLRGRLSTTHQGEKDGNLVTTVHLGRVWLWCHILDYTAQMTRLKKNNNESICVQGSWHIFEESGAT